MTTNAKHMNLHPLKDVHSSFSEGVQTSQPSQPTNKQTNKDTSKALEFDPIPRSKKVSTCEQAFESRFLSIVWWFQCGFFLLFLRQCCCLCKQVCTLIETQTPYWFALDLWKINFEKWSSTKCIFSLFQTWFLQAMQTVKIQFEID